VHKLICASNENKVLTDFINTGVYDANRSFFLTSSPSMDILISSNLERLLWHLSGGNSAEITGYMKELETKGRYTASNAVKNGLADFYGGYAEMDTVHAAIAALWNEERYLIDTHTAVAYSVYLDYLEKTGDDTPVVIASTASAYKFADRVAETLGLPAAADSFAYIDALYDLTSVPVPDGLKGLREKKITQTGTVAPDRLKDAIEGSLG
jgi:threonine synthase